LRFVAVDRRGFDAFGFQLARQTRSADLVFEKTITCFKPRSRMMNDTASRLASSSTL
jgi:hypothetical protein